MREAFTLLEMMVVVAIIGAMLVLGVASISAGKGAARVKGAARDVYAAVRHARSVALVTGQRVVVKYSNETDEEGPIARVEIVSVKIMNSDAEKATAQPYWVEDYKGLPTAGRRPVASPGQKTEETEATEQEGETVEDILFAPMSEEVVRGMRLKVVKGEDGGTDETDVQKRQRVSVSSNVDWLLKLYEGEQQKTTEKKESQEDSGSSNSSDDVMMEPVSVVWQTNGAVEPHDVWIYAEGQKPEDGLLLRIDQFGAVKVLSGDGSGESD